MARKTGIKKDWPVISTRVSPEQETLIRKKHPNKGDVSKLLQALICRYLDGRIIGVRV